MKTAPPYLLLFSALLLSTSLMAQVGDSTLLLREVEVVSPRLQPAQTGIDVLVFDSTQLLTHQHQNLADLLANESPVFVKSYGLGSLATTSFRGGSAYHTAILWNGISLSSPMNGLADLSLLPMAAADEVYIQEGAGSALFGSGAVAGAIHLAGNPAFNRGLKGSVDVSVGSFADFRQNVSFEISRKTWVSSLRLFHTSAQNNFPFQNPSYPDSAKTRQSNAELRNLGLIQENRFRLGKHHTLQLNAWLQTTHRNIPPTLQESAGTASQGDDALRLHAGWNYARNRLSTFVRAAWLQEQVDYTDPLYNLQAFSQTRQLVSEAEARYALTPVHAFNLGLHHTYASATHDAFLADPVQNRTALFGAYEFKAFKGALQTRLAARAEVVDGSFVPFTYSLGADYQVAPWLSLRGSASKVYRLPTFNDWYWVPGGNPRLLPESGFAEELGANLVFQGKHWGFTTSITAFNRNISNWILWLPGPLYWSPENVQEVWSRGLETRSTLSYTRGKMRYALTVLTGYTRAENQTAAYPGDATVGKQLIYTPVFTGMAKVSVERGGFAAFYRHTYTGYRYTTTDNSQYLEPFALGAVNLSYRAQQLPYAARVFVEVNNLWNAQYQVISNRPMPGINVQVGLSFQFQKS